MEGWILVWDIIDSQIFSLFVESAHNLKWSPASTRQEAWCVCAFIARSFLPGTLLQVVRLLYD